MGLVSMKFKGYAWPHNPKIYSVNITRDVANYKIPGGGWYSREMGQGLRVVSGQGEFAGSGAYEQFKELQALYSEGGEGQLVHPVWKTMTAFFTSLTLVQEPKSDYVRYSFTFTECGKDADSAALILVDSKGAEGVPETVKKLRYLTFCAESSFKYRNLVAGANGCRLHTMRRGQTIWTVCALYGISYLRLFELNPGLKSPHLLTADYMVRIV